MVWNTIVTWFTANAQPIIYIIVAIGLALLAWKTSFGARLVAVLSYMSRMRWLIALILIVIVILVVSGEIMIDKYLGGS